MDERRRSPRFDVRDVTAVLRLPVGARLIAVSGRRALLETAQPLRVEAACNLVVPGRPAPFHGVVAACRLRAARAAAGEAGPVYEGTVDLAADPPPFGEVDTAHAVRLELLLPFVVRSLSQNGALIEGDRELLMGSMVDAELQLSGESWPARLRIVFGRERGERGGLTQYQHGAEFVRLSTAAADALARFLMSQPV